MISIGESDVASIKAWMEVKLNAICDPEIADPVVLADYVIVLLKNDERSTDALKEHCRAKLSDFLDNETDGFIAELFGYLDRREYEGTNGNGQEDEDDGTEVCGRRGRDADSDNDYTDDEDESRRKRRHLDDSYSDEQIDNAVTPSVAQTGAKPWKNDYSDNNRSRGRQEYSKGDRSGHNNNKGVAGQASNFSGAGMGMGMGMMDPSMMMMQQGGYLGGFPGGAQINPMMYMNQMAAMGMGGGFPGAPGGLPAAGGPAPPQGAPPPPPPSGPPPVPRSMPPQQDSFGRGGGGRGRGPRQQHLADGERCTLKCSGVPTYTKPTELLLHFHSFGRLVATRCELNGRAVTAVELEAVQASAGESKGSHQYFDYYAQYVSVEDAKKCHGSAKAILGNRFIKLFIHSDNLVPPGEVMESMINALESEVAMLKKASSHSSGGKPAYGGDAPGKRAAGGNMKWTGPGAKEGVGDSSACAPPAPYVKKPYAAFKTNNAAEDTKRKFQELQQLKQTAEGFYQRKRDLLQTQLDQVRLLLHKLTGKTDPESMGLAENLEVKVMSLQQQLREVEEKNQNSSSVAAHVSGATAGTGGSAVGADGASAPVRHPADRFGGGGRAGRGGWAAGRGRVGGGWVQGAGRGRGFMHNATPVAVAATIPAGVSTAPGVDSTPASDNSSVDPTTA